MRAIPHSSKSAIYWGIALIELLAAALLAVMAR
jgi:hypothetical protein